MVAVTEMSSKLRDSCVVLVVLVVLVTTMPTRPTNWLGPDLILGKGKTRR